MRKNWRAGYAHLCPDCLSDFKYRNRKTWKALPFWPASLYHAGQTRKCEWHYASSTAATAARRAALLNQTPPWANKGLTRAVYAEAARLTNQTGVFHDVDHVVPLRGRLVSGLHVHYNLKPIPWHVNRSKSNRFQDG